MDRQLLIPIAIMAHNEEKVILRAIESSLNQRGPIGHSVRVLVVANGCTDMTEKIVDSMANKHPDRVTLISMREKGKTKAINRVIRYLEDISSESQDIPYVVFLDADCEFIGEKALVNFVERFEETPELCAVAADRLPDVFFNARKDIVAEIYRAIYKLGEFLQINSISGMCYAIKFDILKKIDFPDLQFNEDMFVASRLDGWFYKDKNIKIAFGTPSNLKIEINRRSRQEICTQRYQEYYSYLRGLGVKVNLFEKQLGDGYRWGAADGSVIKAWLKLKGIKPRVFAVAYVLIRMLSKIDAFFKLKMMKKSEDYWKVMR
jgi:glycosyltransferase involved in cell wall biosynthesis